jgi:uncharacterized protein (DUF1697 family)
MEKVRALFVAAGHQEVATYIQSGNVVFDSPSRAVAAIAADLEARIRRDLDVEVSVLLRSAKELALVVAANPFRPARASPTKLHVTFLTRAPKAAAVAAIDPTPFAPDEFVHIRRELYVHCPTGYGRTKLNNTFFERRLAVSATTRNWNTVTKLAQLAGRATPAKSARA